jgi:hypothetical protein
MYTRYPSRIIYIQNVISFILHLLIDLRNVISTREILFYSYFLRHEHKFPELTNDAYCASIKRNNCVHTINTEVMHFSLLFYAQHFTNGIVYVMVDITRLK